MLRNRTGARDDPENLRIDIRMLLQTIQNAGHRPMSAVELQRLWSPSWSMEEVLKMLSELKKLKLIKMQDGRYLAVKPVESGHLFQESHGRTYLLQGGGQ